MSSFARWVRVFLFTLAVVLTSRHVSAADAPKPAAPVDEEAADSPRVSVRNFLDLAERGRFEEAAVYLELPRGTEKRGADLASKLYIVLTQRLLIVPEQLSPLAAGRATDGLAAGTEELGKIEDPKGHPVPIRLVRHESKSTDDEARWVFSQSTVARVDTLYAALKGRWLRDKLPLSLRAMGPLGIYYWQWVVLPVLAAIAIAAGRFLAWLAAFGARRLFASRPWRERLVTGLKYPVTVACALAVFALLLPHLSLTLVAEDLVHRLLRALAYLTFFWALLRSVAVLGDELKQADWARTRPTARSLSTVAVSLGKVIVAAFALMVALSELGYPVTTVIAGLGIGGVALALAAQKTVENLFGSLSILIDQPFRVGDTIKVDTIEGTVESIGLRSTRVRTVERTLIVFPNGKLADMRIESLGPRDRIRFATKLQLARETTTAQLLAVVAAVKTRLGAHDAVRKDDVFARFSLIGADSYDIDASAPVETTDAVEFARIKEELLVECLAAIADAGAKLAVPTVAFPSQGGRAEESKNGKQAPG